MIKWSAGRWTALGAVEIGRVFAASVISGGVIVGARRAEKTFVFPALHGTYLGQGNPVAAACNEEEGEKWPLVEKPQLAAKAEFEGDKLITSKPSSAVHLYKAFSRLTCTMMCIFKLRHRRAPQPLSGGTTTTHNPDENGKNTDSTTLLRKNQITKPTSCRRSVHVSKIFRVKGERHLDHGMLRPQPSWTAFRVFLFHSAHTGTWMRTTAEFWAFLRGFAQPGTPRLSTDHTRTWSGTVFPPARQARPSWTDQRGQRRTTFVFQDKCKRQWSSQDSYPCQNTSLCPCSTTPRLWTSSTIWTLRLRPQFGPQNHDH